MYVCDVFGGAVQSGQSQLAGDSVPGWPEQESTRQWSGVDTKEGGGSGLSEETTVCHHISTNDLLTCAWIGL